MWCRVTRHPRVFRELTGCQRDPRDRGVTAPVGSSMPKSASFLLKGKKSTIGGIMIAYLFVVEWVGIYKEKLWLLSLLDSDTVSLTLGEKFPFPFHGPTVNG